MEEIYDTIVSDVHETHGDAPEHSRIHSCATPHLVYRFIGMFSSLSKTRIVDDNVFNQDVADLHYKSQCILQELRTKRDGSPVAAAEHDLINQKISDICDAKHINIVFEQLEKEAKQLATWAGHYRRESSAYFKRIRDSSIAEIDATRPAVHLQQRPYAAAQRLISSYATADHVRKARRLNES